MNTTIQNLAPIVLPREEPHLIIQALIYHQVGVHYSNCILLSRVRDFCKCTGVCELEASESI